MKKLFTFLFLAFSLCVSAQVQKNVIVEIFTNTRCSTCGFREPQIFNSLSKYPEVLQISFYPSSPYSNCFFSQQNRREYDGRTRYYGVYGSTPRVFVQGSEVNNNIDTANLVAALGQTSNFEIKLSHLKTAQDSARITATIFKRANDPLSTANLYLATAENEIQYNAPNGVNTHHNVMRKAHTDSNGVSITLPSSIGDSIEVAVTYRLESNWNHNILSSFAILSNQNSVVNAQKTSLDLNGFFPTSINDIKTSSEISIYPNPISVGNNLVIETIDKG